MILTILEETENTYTNDYWLRVCWIGFLDGDTEGGNVPWWDRTQHWIFPDSPLSTPSMVDEPPMSHELESGSNE